MRQQVTTNKRLVDKRETHTRPRSNTHAHSAITILYCYVQNVFILLLLE